MKSALLVSTVAALGLAAPAHADITFKTQSSIQLTVDGAGSVATRLPSTLAVSGSNVTLDTVPSLGALNAGSAVGYTPGAFSITNTGDSFSYSESFIEGDATPSATTVTGGVVTALPMLGSTTTTSGGVASTLAGTLDSGGELGITAGGAGTTAIGQFVTSITVD
jgi:hypothetical protein